MKRFLIFALLGPAIGFVTFFWVLLQLLNVALGAPTTYDWHQVVLLPMAYLIGIVPALFAALFDQALAKRGVRYRIFWTALFSYAAGFLPIVTSLLAGHIHGPYVLAFGLIGAVPGAICSWLAGRYDHNKLSPPNKSIR